jgi:hypothetical protein
MAEVGGLHLLTQEFLIDEAVENGAAIIVGETGDRAISEESFVAEGFIEIGLQDDAAIDGGDDAVDDFGGRWRRGDEERGEKKREGEGGRGRRYRAGKRKSHQNG